MVWTPYFANSYDWNWFLDDPVPFTIGDWPTPPIQLGDVNGDGAVNISDVTTLIDYLLGNNVEIVAEASDINGDGVINISDATALIDMVLGNGEA